MYAGAQQASTQQMANGTQWSTRFTQCAPPADTCDWCVSCFFFPCVTAVAKGRADGTDPIYNFCCWNSVASFSYLRYEYGIVGSCGDDCATMLMCTPCGARQMLTESRLRQRSGRPGALAYGQNLDPWTFQFFDCSCMQMCRTCVCPCYVAAEIRETLQPNASQDNCFNCCCLAPCAMYGQVRNHYGLLADCPLLEDLVLASLCWPCALNRASREASDRHLRAMQAGMGQMTPQQVVAGLVQHALR